MDANCNRRIFICSMDNGISWSVVFMSSWTAKQIHKQQIMEEIEDKRNKEITKILEGRRCPDERSYIKCVVTERRKNEGTDV